MPTVPTVNTRGGGINPQLDVLVGRLLNRGSGSTYNPEVSAEAASALGIMPKRRSVPQAEKLIRERDLAEALAASNALPDSTRATVQMRVLADPAAWSRSEWP